MRRSIQAIVVALILGIGWTAFTSPSTNAGGAQALVRWEYRVVEGNINFDQLGGEGWELVAVYPGFKTGVYAYFKRPRR